MNRTPLEKLVRQAFEADPERKRTFVESNENNDDLGP